MNGRSRRSLRPLARAASSAMLAGVFLLGCGNLPGKPKPGPEVVRPEAVLDFPTLYGQNCAACHGSSGMNGASYPLANPEYLALVNDATLRTVIAQGRPNSLMPAFASEAGGTLTDAQVEVLVKGIRTKWAKPNAFSGATPPAYRSTLQGNAAAGETAYSTYCASCHGPVPAGPHQASQPPAGGNAPAGKAGSITGTAFLALITDQALRTTIIAGRPDIGQPDWKSDVAGRPMSDQEVTDVVAWLSSRRQAAGGNAAANSQSSANPPSVHGKQAATKHKED